jgi:predicted O-linked N-acetylglucosamine transferase (SPINDLY family)
MNSGDAQNRNRKAAEYLQLLGVLATELEKAMHAIAHNALSELEESVANQHALSSKLTALVSEICVPLETEAAGSQTRLDESMMQQIRSASDSLETLNRRYAALLQHSSRCVAQMAALFNSARGQIKEGSGPRVKYQTWSCQM